MVRNMKAGIVINAGDPLAQVELAARAEAAGWDGVFTYDAIDIGGSDMYDPWTSLLRRDGTRHVPGDPGAIVFAPDPSAGRGSGPRGDDHRPPVTRPPRRAVGLRAGRRFGDSRLGTESARSASRTRAASASGGAHAPEWPRRTVRERRRADPARRPRSPLGVGDGTTGGRPGHER